MFKKKTNKFAFYLVDFAKHLNETVDYFAHFKVKDKESLQEFATKIKEYESEADGKVHTIIKELNQAFITPIDREDILELTMTLDDIIDGIDAFSTMLDIYQIYDFDTYTEQFTEYFLKSSTKIVESMELIAHNKLVEVEPHAILLKDYESHCDDIYHEALRHLFQTEKDPIKVIQYKEIYEGL